MALCNFRHWISIYQLFCPKMYKNDEKSIDNTLHEM